MKTTLTLLSFLIAAMLSSCTAPHGNGTQTMIPRTNVENLERQSAVTPSQGMGIDGYAASRYANRSHSNTIYIPSSY